MTIKSSTWINVAALVAAIVSPLRLGAQGHTAKHHQYVLKDLGTFGGPNSYVSTNPLEKLLTTSGMVVGYADTSVFEPFSPNINDDPFVEHAFVWNRDVLTDLGTLPKGFSSTAFATNERGMIVGGSENGEMDPLTGYPQIDAVLWSDGRILNLGTLGGNQSIAGAINNRGQIVGGALNVISDPFANDFSLQFFAQPAATQVHAFLWEAGTMQDLGTLGGPDSFAAFINERGEIAGESFTDYIPASAAGQPILHPFLWIPCDRDHWDSNDRDHDDCKGVPGSSSRRKGRMIDLGTLGGDFGVTNALNNRGQVVGSMSLADQTVHPFLWNRGSLTDLGTLGGNNGQPFWISDSGEVVGSADLPGSQVHHAFLWKHRVMTDLGTLKGDPCSNAHHINSKGQVVGNSGICGVGGHAFLWEDGGPAVNLDTLVAPGSDLQVINAFFINDAGDIVCRGKLANGDRHVCLLIPTGEDEDADGTDTVLRRKMHD